nr:MAG TPA: hypothetical protein [Caudoviricetes sp.]
MYTMQNFTFCLVTQILVSAFLFTPHFWHNHIFYDRRSSAPHPKHAIYSR